STVQLLHLGSNMHCNDATSKVIEAHIAPSNLFHDGFQCGRIWKSCQRIRQVAVFFESLADNCTEKRRKFIEVEIKEGAENFSRWMANFQADNSTARAYYTQHLTEPLTYIS